ncbi:pyridoxal phosphate-dependent decarboxylase family protein [Actinoalloteichus caeruleus]|uniref:pyridoxal phosphate-dependent decarboxylase family protein n=1 Tax=Actinoalloteichus cyanogriseus TaxID=2893586 RepID=UPI0009DE7B45|nr:pyridoxal-dependent decarboxylase [Actinoalloteichus caeruleus]
MAVVEPPSPPMLPGQGTASARRAARAHLLHNETVEHYRQVLSEGIDRVARTVADARRPCTGISPDELDSVVSSVDLDRPLADTTAALDELVDVYLRDAIFYHHPRYLAHLNSPVAIPALLAEVVLSALNSSLDTWDQSAGATLIERRLVDWTARRIGFDDRADGVFTSGGTQSNLQGLLLAREELLAGLGAGTDRHGQWPRLRVLVSEVGHFSVRKAARLLGLGPGAVLPVPTDRSWRMSPTALARELDRCRRRGEHVVAVVATAGTTDFGSIDPLPEIAARCADAGVWLHVDAAYGGGLLLSRTRSHLLTGIDRADSVTIDFHKTFFQPVSSSALVVRDGTALRHATDRADYLNPRWMADRDIPNQVDKSLQTTRRFDALKLWLTLRVTGADQLGELVDELVERTSEAWRALSGDPRFEVVTRSPLSTVVFRHLPEGADPELVDEANLHAREALAGTGDAVVAATRVRGRHYLKLTLLNPRTTVEDITRLAELVAEHAGDHVRAHHADTAPDTAERRAACPSMTSSPSA